MIKCEAYYSFDELNFILLIDRWYKFICLCFFTLSTSIKYMWILSFPTRWINVHDIVQGIETISCIYLQWIKLEIQKYPYIDRRKGWDTSSLYLILQNQDQPIKITVIKYRYCFSFSNYDVIDREYCDESNRFESFRLTKSTLMWDEAYLLSNVHKHNAYHQ